MRSPCLALLASLVPLGCDAPPPPSTTPAARSADAPTDPPDDLATPRPKKGAVIGGEQVPRTIAWPHAAAIDSAARDRLSARTRDDVDSAALPVLLPDVGLERGAFTPGDGWYAFSTRDDASAIGIVVQGSARATIFPHIRRAEPTQTVRGQGAFVSKNEGIWVVSWIEHGAAYSLEVECDDPRAPACESPDRAVALVQALALVGGKGVH